MSNAPSQRRKWRFRFRLRTLLLAFFLGSLSIGWGGRQLRKYLDSKQRIKTAEAEQLNADWARELRQIVKELDVFPKRGRHMLDTPTPEWKMQLMLAERQARLRPDTLDDREQKLAEELAARRELRGGLQGSSDAAPDPAFARP